MAGSPASITHNEGAVVSRWYCLSLLGTIQKTVISMEAFMVEQG